MTLPNSADANFFANLLNREASAKEEVKTTENLQNISLLEANISSSAILNKKELNESVSLNISGDALLPAVGPLTPTGETEEDSFSYQEISIYVVRPGDNVNDIAKMFDVSVNTILWANDMTKGDKLKVGDTLIILPVDGVKHVVKKGDTIKNIAKIYGVETRDIYEFNSLDEKTLLTVGEEIIIPGAEIKEQPKPKTTIAKKPTSSSKPSGLTNLNRNIQGGVIPNNFRSADNSTPIPGYFIKPVEGPRCRLTQGKHDRYAIDIGCPTGTPIYASASGKVIFAKVGWNGAFGNLVIIAHPNGTQTFYAHQSKLAVSIGDQVNQGDVIGYVGNTGRSTGPHIHFEVRGAKNPGFDNSWAR